jgi:hypothetical protein
MIICKIRNFSMEVNEHESDILSHLLRVIEVMI